MLVAGMAMLLYSAAPAAATQAQSATPFCQRDFSDPAKRRNDIAELEAAGGLVHLLKRPQATPPFKCAAFYLAHGLDVNAVGPDGLTALHYAIKVNQPKMVRFVIAQGADLTKKAGEKQLEPIAYAYYLALNNSDIERSRVITILSKALHADTQ